MSQRVPPAEAGGEEQVDAVDADEDGGEGGAQDARSQEARGEGGKSGTFRTLGPKVGHPHGAGRGHRGGEHRQRRRPQETGYGVGSDGAGRGTAERTAGDRWRLGGSISECARFGGFRILPRPPEQIRRGLTRSPCRIRASFLRGWKFGH
jgi:hypothetical protein